MKRSALLVAVSLWSLCSLSSLSCGGGADDDGPEPTYGASYALEGALNGPRVIRHDHAAPNERVDVPGPEGSESPAFGGARVACSLVGEVDRAGSRGVLVVSAVDNYGEEHGPGVYLRVVGFEGPGRYALDGERPGRVWLFDDAHVQTCVRPGDRKCYQGNDGCEVVVDRWDVSSTSASGPPGVLYGEASGQFRCRSLVNATTGATVRIVQGSFWCPAGDWRAEGEAPPR